MSIHRDKGVVLVISLMVMSVLLVLVGAHFSGLLTEKRSADVEEYLLQAISLAESGASQAQAELRQRIRLDLQNNVGQVIQAAVFTPYVASAVTSLNFLRDYAFSAGDTQFSVPALDAASGEQQTFLDIVPLNLVTNVQGNYAARIFIRPNGNPSVAGGTTFTFPYKYTIEAQGTVVGLAAGLTRRVRLLYGTFILTVQKGNFAEFALFTNHHTMPNGTPVWFTQNTNFNGPLHSNERFSFANNPSGVFTAQVTQHENLARFYNNGSPLLIDADNNDPHDVPVFQTGFTRGVDSIILPSTVRQQELKSQATGGQNDSAWSNGIYLPNVGGNVTGGIYIKGNASNVTMSTDASNRPVYNVTYGANTKKITVDYANNQTIVANLSGNGGTAPGTYQGIPDGTGNEGSLIYSTGSISNFSGTVQRDTKLMVSSNSDIVINNNITYQDFNAGPPLNATGFNNLLGVISWRGDVRVATSAPDNLNIHAVVMAPGLAAGTSDGIFTVDNYSSGSPRGTLTLLGGSITDYYGPFGTFSGDNQVSGYGRNFVYDARMSNGALPPYFPYTTNFDSNISDSNSDGVDDLSNKLIWQDRGA